MLLELAASYAARPPPARTLVFLAVTGEEHGLLGSRAYVERAGVSPADVVAAINLEMVGRPDPALGGPGRLWVTGYDRTNLGAAWTALGLPIDPDPRPEQRYDERSDHVPFARVGVVGVTLSSFGSHADYHALTDEWATLDPAHLRAVAEVIRRAVEPLAEGELRPAWREP